MRALLCLALLATGCTVQGNECELDSECDGLACARDGACYAASDVRSVRTTWTINGAAADASACADRTLFIQFRSPQLEDPLAFSPVTCFTGQFTIDKLPTHFTSVELGVENGNRGSSAIRADGTATFDLAL